MMLQHLTLTRWVVWIKKILNKLIISVRHIDPIGFDHDINSCVYVTVHTGFM